MPSSVAHQQEYELLCAPPTNAPPAWLRQRGYRFEQLLNGLLVADALDPRTSFKPSGEQIDGSFFFDGTVFLLEAKWQAGAIPASELYGFKGKVDGKLLGTLGVFISMSGYSEDAVDALTLGKSLNLILFDQADIDAIVRENFGFREVLRRKMRAAAEQGLVYLPMKSMMTTKAKSAPASLERLEFEPISGEVFFKSTPSSITANLLILCEAPVDSEVISTLAQRILVAESKNTIIHIVVARGKRSIPRLANVLRSNVAPNVKILLVTDGDRDVAGTLTMLKQNIDFSDWEVSIPDPGIESWLGLNPEQLRKSGPMSRVMTTLNAAKSIDLQRLRNKDSAFNAFYHAISEA